MKWENLGIAPPYRDHRIAFRLKDENGNNSAVTITDTSISGWLPGEKDITIEYEIPGDIKPDKYSIELGIVYHNAPDRVIPIANKGQTSDGWYSIGKIKISL